jgi:chemosensory pili system protein ChpA (sensor histidine kinase/response regulator)
VADDLDDVARALREVFRVEAGEHLDAAETAVAALRAGPTAAEPHAELRRRLHTLKGASATVGLTAIAALAHTAEEAIDAAPRAGPPSAADVERIAEAVEALRARATADLDSPAPATAAATPGATSGDAAAAGGSVSRRERHLLRVEAERLEAAMDDLGELLLSRTRMERRLMDLEGLIRDARAVRRGLAAAALDVGRPETTGRGQVALREMDGQYGAVLTGLERLRATLTAETATLQSVTAALRARMLDVRMGPARSLLARVGPTAREAARREGKRVETEVAGGDVDLDQIIVDRVGEALLHLVRNAVAHGIEHPDVRERLGKPAAGRVWVEARAGRASVEIDVSDDGGGIDPARVRKALVASGFARAEDVARLDDERVLRRIFEPGLSTRGDADELAGRGVGLDAVAATVADLGGEITVESTAGRGARFHIWLPSTAALTHALLFKVGGHVYAVPAAAVVEIIHVELITADRADRGEPLHFGERDIPLVRLRPILGGDFPPGGLRRGPVIVLEHDGERFAITCHKVIGTREIVVKSLGPLLGRLPLFAGATISGGGTVQLLLDVGELHELARDRRRIRRARSLTPRPLVGRRVLIADDSRSVREALAAMLAQAGFAVEVAADGWEAWERLQDRAFDVLITDLEMPRVHGWDLIAKCRTDPALRRLPIVVLTARTGDHGRQRAMRAGADAFSGKPPARRAILDQIADALAARQPTPRG